VPGLATRAYHPTHCCYQARDAAQGRRAQRINVHLDSINRHVERQMRGAARPSIWEGLCPPRRAGLVPIKLMRWSRTVQRGRTWSTSPRLTIARMACAVYENDCRSGAVSARRFRQALRLHIETGGGSRWRRPAGFFFFSFFFGGGGGGGVGLESRQSSDEARTTGFRRSGVVGSSAGERDVLRGHATGCAHGRRASSILPAERRRDGTCARRFARAVGWKRCTHPGARGGTQADGGITCSRAATRDRSMYRSAAEIVIAQRNLGVIRPFRSGPDTKFRPGNKNRGRKALRALDAVAPLTVRMRP